MMTASPVPPPATNAFIGFDKSRAPPNT